METVGVIGYIIRVILGLYGDNGRENGNYHNGLYRVWDCGHTKLIMGLPRRG